MTPMTRYALVEIDPTEKMANAGYDAMRDPSTNLPAPWIVLGTAINVHTAMLTASPNGGCVTAEMLERAARIIDPGAWTGSDDVKLTFRRRAKEKARRIAEEAFGLQVDAPAGEVVDG